MTTASESTNNPQGSDVFSGLRTDDPMSSSPPLSELCLA